jgi:hypothetical protein
MPVDLQKIETQLAEVNAIVGQINPLIGVIGGVVELAIHTARTAGVDPAVIAAFETSWADYQTKRAALAAALDEFHAKYPTPPSA